jgi:hypothetical protein
MGAPALEVGYTSATTRRGYHEVYMDIGGDKKKTVYFRVFLKIHCSFNLIPFGAQNISFKGTVVHNQPPNSVDT